MEKHNKCMILKGYSKHRMPSLDPLNMIFFVFGIVILFYDSNEIPQKMAFGDFAKFITKRKQTNTHAKGNPSTCQKTPRSPKG
jgi:hypothetical protein